MHPLSPLAYAKEICTLTFARAISSLCLTTLLFLFGNNLVPLIVALSMWFLDTLTGVYAAWLEQKVGKNKLTSKRGWEMVPKLIAIFSAFITGNLMALFYPAGFGDAIKYGIASVIITVEAASILENVQRMDSRYSFQEIIKKFKK